MGYGHVTAAEAEAKRGHRDLRSSAPTLPSRVLFFERIQCATCLVFLNLPLIIDNASGPHIRRPPLRR